jgi:hypothetical protein
VADSVIAWLTAAGAVALCLFLPPATAYAANDCPWLNEATASGLISADSVGTYTAATPTQPAVCAFAEKSGLARDLTITVEAASDPHARMKAMTEACANGAAPLTAIGNEAVYCAADPRGGIGERVIGRVRNQVFSITLSSPIKNDPILTRDALKARIHEAAEQVSGNLF